MRLHVVKPTKKQIFQKICPTKPVKSLPFSNEEDRHSNVRLLSISSSIRPLVWCFNLITWGAADGVVIGWAAMTIVSSGRSISSWKVSQQPVTLSRLRLNKVVNIDQWAFLPLEAVYIYICRRDMGFSVGSKFYRTKIIPCHTDNAAIIHDDWMTWAALN